MEDESGETSTWLGQRRASRPQAINGKQGAARCTDTASSDPTADQVANEYDGEGPIACGECNEGRAGPLPPARVVYRSSLAGQLLLVT